LGELDGIDISSASIVKNKISQSPISSREVNTICNGSLKL
jgi:hypothetical protein